MSEKVILVDVDGTLADSYHREHFLEIKPKNWNAYYNLALEDKPFDDIVWLVKLLKDCGNTILIVTARSEDRREITEKWLNEKAGLSGIYDKIYMREMYDYRDDDVCKKDILDMIRKDGYDPYLVLDDRKMVVDMWRNEGLTCLQVRDGV
jgi:FMN phosphatase YigB (HAD superfamily)